MDSLAQSITSGILIDLCKLRPDDIRGDAELEQMAVNLYQAIEKATAKARENTPRWARILWAY